MKTWKEVRTRQHDISGIENPGNWLFEEKNGIWYPKEESQDLEEQTAIKTLLKVLWEHREKLESKGANTNTVQWIDETIDLVEICFLGNMPDGDRQQEIYDSGETWNFKSALQEIFARLENSDYFNYSTKD